jgi:hypothetical protein
VTWKEAISSFPQSIRWVHHGRNPSTGLDCIGFVICVYQKRGIDVSSLDRPYGIRDCKRDANGDRLAKQMEPKFVEVHDGPLIDGDVVILGRPAHVAVVCEGKMVYMNGVGLQKSPICGVKRVFRYAESR